MQNKRSKEKASSRKEAIANGKPKWVAPTSYFIFSFYAIISGMHAHTIIVAQVYIRTQDTYTATPIPALMYSEHRFHTNRACLHKCTFIHTTTINPKPLKAPD